LFGKKRILEKIPKIQQLPNWLFQFQLTIRHADVDPKLII
jgi:hypothetical protein